MAFIFLFLLFYPPPSPPLLYYDTFGESNFILVILGFIHYLNASLELIAVSTKYLYTDKVKTELLKMLLIAFPLVCFEQTWQSMKPKKWVLEKKKFTSCFSQKMAGYKMKEPLDASQLENRIKAIVDKYPVRFFEWSLVILARMFSKMQSCFRMALGISCKESPIWSVVFK